MYPTQNEISYVKPSVLIGSATAGSSSTSSAVTDMECLRITRRTGITPSTCDLRYTPGQDVQGPATLTKGGSYKHKQRVIVYSPETSRVWFHGWLEKRLDQHKQNCVIWTANGDTVLLRHQYVKGCFVMDNLLSGEQQLKYSAALGAVFNPNGAWNCTGYDLDGEIYPVFTPTAVYGKAYESPDTDYSGDPPTDGSHVPWTPRRILKYLQLVMHNFELLGVVPGEAPLLSYGSIKQDYLYLNVAHINSLSAIDPAISEKDPLDRIAPSTSLQGDTLAGAFEKTLKMTGTHQLCTIYDTTSLTAGKTLLRFKPKMYASQDDWLSISVQFNNTVTVGQGDIFDFSLQEDSTNVVTYAYCEGENKKVETRLEYEYGTYGPADTIAPAWTNAEKNAFLGCVCGDPTRQEAKQFAVMPKVSGSTSTAPADYIKCDGNNGTPVVRAMTRQAMELAQQHYPLVFRAFLVRNTATLKNALGQYSLETPRPILPTQLQFISYRAGDLGDNRLRFNLPIRLSIQPTEDDEFYDVPKDTTIRITTDEQGVNLLWLDGCGISVDGSLECIYGPGIEESFQNIKEDYIKLRNFRINVAMERDDRTSGFAFADNLPNVSDEQKDAFTGLALPHIYIDEPNSYRSHTQVNSYPSSTTKYYGGEDGETEITMPLNRDVPPGVEEEAAKFAAERALSSVRRPVRNSSWMRAGIHHDINAGDWLGYVYVYENDQPTEYLVDSAINTVVLDFLQQTTKVGDVFGDAGTFGF